MVSGSTFARVAEYVDFLNSVTPDNQDEYLLQMRRFNLGPVGEADCPVFDGMFDYCAVCQTWPKGTCLPGIAHLCCHEQQICESLAQQPDGFSIVRRLEFSEAGHDHADLLGWICGWRCDDE